MTARRATLAEIIKQQEKKPSKQNFRIMLDYEISARELGISRSTLFSKIKEHGIKRKKPTNYTN